jgi:aldose 1-epimerase
MQTSRLRLEFAPQYGGALTGLDYIGTPSRHVPILRRCSLSQLVARDARVAAMFVMVPFANRIPGNTIPTSGATLSTPPNVPDQPLAIHGTGWQREWRVEETSDEFTRLSLEVTADDYPIPFRAVQTFRLSEATFTASLGIRNISNEAIPAGIGFHPFFTRTGATRLTFSATHLWPEGPDRIPSRPQPMPAGPDFANGAALPQHSVNDCYSGWDGAARIEGLEDGLSVSLRASSGLSALMLYAPAGEDFFALEPQTHVSGQVCPLEISSSGPGLGSLAAGESLVEEMAIEIV